MKNLKKIIFFIVAILMSFSLQAETVEQRTEKLLAQNRAYVFNKTNVDSTKGRVPPNIDTQVREFILGKFGGVEIEQYGDRIERQLFNVYFLGKNLYGRKYNDYEYYTYRFGSSVDKKDSKGMLSRGRGVSFDFNLDVIMKPNGEINEYKWTEKRR